MSTITTIKNSVIAWIAFSATVIAVGLSYAAYTSITLSDADSGKTITSTLIKSLINNDADLDSRITSLSWAISSITSPRAYVNFNGSTCSTTCSIRSSKNVTSVTYSANVYTVNFAAPLADANYTYMVMTNSRATNTKYSLTIDGPTPTTSSLSFSTSGYDNPATWWWFGLSNQINVVVY